MELGLKGKIKQTYEELQKIRSGNISGPVALGGKRDVSLVEYLSAQYPAGCDKEGIFDVNHLYGELGINPNKMTVSQLIDLDQDSRWLVPEIFRDAIRKGIRTSPFYNSLVAVSESVSQPQVNMPFLELSDAEPKDTAEGETISKGSISYGNKTTEIFKQAIGVSISYEAIQYTSINLLTIFIQDVGVKLGHKLNNEAVDVLINGDQPSGSEAAATIGVSTLIPPGLTYRDLVYAWIRASRLGRRYDHIVTSERGANRLLNLDEFKQKQAGTPISSMVLNETLPSQSQVFVSGRLTQNQYILLDPRYALVQLTSAPLNVEGDKIISKQIQEAYASITTGFGVIFRDARVIVDDSLDVAVNDFPNWMAPTI